MYYENAEKNVEEFYEAFETMQDLSNKKIIEKITIKKKNQIDSINEISVDLVFDSVLNKSQAKANKIDPRLFENTSTIIENQKNIISPNSTNNFICNEIEYDNSENKLGTIYETPINSSEDEIDEIDQISITQINQKFDEKLKNFLKNNQLEDEEIYEEIEESQSRTINNIDFNIINQIDINFIRNNFKLINVKNKNVSQKNRHFKQLYELQNFQIDEFEIWNAKINLTGHYLATGGKSGIIKIFEIIDCDYNKFEHKYDIHNIINFLRFINETPYREYNEHSSDIIDISWSNFNPHLFLSGSMDHLVILWNISNPVPIMKFIHSSVVTSISFCPVLEDGDEKFASGCLDKLIRIWSPKQNKVLDYINLKEYITSISYFPTGDMIAIGTHDGKCSIYDCKPKLRYNFSFTCRNRIGKYSHGRKITNIHFINRTKALITTNDSRIRLINISDGKMIHKYKGHVNEEFMIRAYNEEIYDMIISASADGFVYVWNKYNKENDSKKNYSCEFFKPFDKDIPTCSLFLNDISTTCYLKKLFNITTKLFVSTIILNVSLGGRLQILLNIEEIFD